MNATPGFRSQPIGGRGTHRLAVDTLWLIRLRWAAVVGQLVTIGVATFLLRVALPLVPLVSIVAITALSNAVFSVFAYSQIGRPTGSDGVNVKQLELIIVMIVDLLLLTGLLYYAGGPANPFTIFYFVNLALAAVILPARWGWALTAIAIVCVLGLFVRHRPLPELDRKLKPSFAALTTEFTLGHLGQLAALGTCSVVVVFFVTRVTRELQQKEAELRWAEQQRSRSEKLEALGTLAAGAGHELATPLSTIAVVSKELTRHLDGADVPSTVIEDVSLIRREVDHCCTILDRMRGGIARAEDEKVTHVRVKALVSDLLRELSDADRINVLVDRHAGERIVDVPVQSLAQAIRGVLQNALDASPPDEPVEFSVRMDEQWLVFSVRDHGPGMSDEVIGRAGEPFFTTKEPGKGMGLGLFLTRSVVERLNGKLELASPSKQGVTATILLPLTSKTSVNSTASRC